MIKILINNNKKLIIKKIDIRGINQLYSPNNNNNNNNLNNDC